MVISPQQGADLHTAQLTPLSLTVPRFRKIQIGFTFLALACPGSPGKRAVKRVCVCVQQHNAIRIISLTTLTLVMSALPFSALMCSTVSPPLLDSSTLAPASTSTAALLTSFTQTDSSRAVLPSEQCTNREHSVANSE